MSPFRQKEFVASIFALGLIAFVAVLNPSDVQLSGQVVPACNGNNICEANESCTCADCAGQPACSQEQIPGNVHVYTTAQSSRGVIIHANDHNQVRCSTRKSAGSQLTGQVVPSGSFPVRTGSLANDDSPAQNWVYEFAGIEPPFVNSKGLPVGRLSFSPEEVRQHPHYAFYNNLSEMKPGKAYYIMSDRDLYFKCGEGLSNTEELTGVLLFENARGGGKYDKMTYAEYSSVINFEPKNDMIVSSFQPDAYYCNGTCTFEITVKGPAGSVIGKAKSEIGTRGDFDGRNSYIFGDLDFDPPLKLSGNGSRYEMVMRAASTKSVGLYTSGSENPVERANGSYDLRSAISPSTNSTERGAPVFLLRGTCHSCSICTDGDNGKDVSRSAVTAGISPSTQDYYEGSDICVGDSALIEHYCAGQFHTNTTLLCGDGYSCNNGQCKKDEDTTEYCQGGADCAHLPGTSCSVVSNDNPDGDCLPPPNCDPGTACADVCYGVCEEGDLDVTGSLYVTQPVPVSSKQLLGGTTDEVMRIRFSAEKENIDITDIRIGSQFGESIDRLELRKEGEQNPFAHATIGGCLVPKGNDYVFCASMDNQQLIVPKGKQVEIQVLAKMKCDKTIAGNCAGGGVSGEDLIFVVNNGNVTGGYPVEARGVQSSNKLRSNNGDSIADGEIFIGLAQGQESGFDQELHSSYHVSVHSKIADITNANPDVNGTAVQTGVHSIGQFKITAAHHNNADNGLNDVVLDGIILTVTQENISMNYDAFHVYNKSDSTVRGSCSAHKIDNGIVSLSGLSEGDRMTYQVYCTDNLSQIFEIDQGDSATLVLEAEIANSLYNPNKESMLQVSLQSYTGHEPDGFGLSEFDELSHIQWSDTDTVISPSFDWVESSNATVRSTAYGSQTLNQTCGNGIVEGDEVCDDGNEEPLDGCGNECVPCPVPGCAAPTEGCYYEHDDELVNGCPANPCGTLICEENCGNGICEPGEVCPDDCTPIHQCNGDGVCSPTEACDCDDCAGAQICGQPSNCGNGIVDPGEQCDDGNLDVYDGCGNTCKPCPLPACEAPPEGCFVVLDDEIVDGCPANPCGVISCTQVCGDGIIQDPEECDDGNVLGNDGCSAECQAEFCGDGTVQDVAGEQCDNGSACSHMPIECVSDADCRRCMEITDGPGPQVGYCGADENGQICETDADCVDVAYTCEYFHAGNPACTSECTVDISQALDIAVIDVRTERKQSGFSEGKDIINFIVKVENVGNRAVDPNTVAIQVTSEPTDEYTQGYFASSGILEPIAPDETYEQFIHGGYILDSQKTLESSFSFFANVFADSDIDLVNNTINEFLTIGVVGECGNGIPEGLEECDDGDTNNENGCSNSCTETPGWSCVANTCKPLIPTFDF